VRGHPTAFGGLCLADSRCLYSFIVYPFGLFSSAIVNTITGGSDKLTTVFAWNVVINAFYLPGTIGGSLIVDVVKVRVPLVRESDSR